MDDSLINPVLLSSSAHLENVEQLIKNIEQQTLHGDFSHNNISNNHTTQELITKSYSSMDHNLLVKSATLPDGAMMIGRNDESHSIDSLLIQRDLFDKQQISPSIDPSLFNEQDGGYTWDDQYDARANYRLTFSTDKSPQIDGKSEKSRRPTHRSIGQKTSLTCSDDDASTNLTNNINEWSMRSSSNTLEQSIQRSPQIHSPSNPPSSSSQQQQVPNNQSSGSSTTSSSTSWRHMKESQRTAPGTETRDARPPSPLCLYKIFQQKSNITGSSRSRNSSPLNRRQKHFSVPNHTNEAIREKAKTHLNTDQAIQTSMLLESSTNSRHRTTSVTTLKSDSFDHLTSPTPFSPVPIHKSLPDLSFISQYSKELPRSRTTSPSSSITVPRVTPSPTLTQQPKQDLDRPRTLKSIKRYKNSKHSTEPLGVFYSPQLRKTFAAVPIITGSSIVPLEMKIKLPSFSASQTSNLKSCLKYGSRANSCDIQNMIDDPQSPLFAAEPASNKDLISSAFKRRSSDAEKLKHLDTIWSTKIHSNKLSAYILPDSSRGHYSEHDLLSLIQDHNAATKSISLSDNISKQLPSPCNPTIGFNDNLPLAFDESSERLTKRTTKRYRDTRRCQTDIIVVDPVLHLHSFTDSPPNEFCFQRDDHDETAVVMEKSYINIISNREQSMLTTEMLPASPLRPTDFVAIEKETKSSTAMSASTLDNIVETISNIVKRLFEMKQSDKTFFLDNEQNLQLDSLLKNELCSAIQTILEHGRRDVRKTSLWKIIESSVEKNTSTSGQIPRVYYEAKQIAQNISSYWLYRFQAFIFVLLNKNELINWLYYFTRQKDITQRYYQSPDALILVSISSTFNLFERIMTQLEKLTPLTFRLTYHSPTLFPTHDDQMNTSVMSTHPTKTSARDWVMTISRRPSKNLTQPIVQNHSNDTFRSTLSKKLNAFFSKTNLPQQNKSPSVVTAKSPELKIRTKSPGLSRRPRFSSVFSNPSAVAATDVPSPKLKPSVRQGTSPSLGTNITFQSKIPRPSLNVDKPKSVRYRSAASSSK